MRLVTRILGVLGAMCVPAVVMLFGCEVDETRPPGLPNEVPNNRGTPYVQIPSGASSSGSTSGAGGGTVAASICDVAASLEVNPIQACKDCESAAIADPTQCQNVSNACSADTNCLPGVAQCLTGTCAAPGATATCVEDCISQDQNFVNLMGCLLLVCGGSCGQPAPVLCTTVDAGALDGGGPG
jgi:hypothetical protein